MCPIGNLKLEQQSEYADSAQGCYALSRVLCFPGSFARQITIKLFQTPKFKMSLHVYCYTVLILYH